MLRRRLSSGQHAVRIGVGPYVIPALAKRLPWPPPAPLAGLDPPNLVGAAIRHRADPVPDLTWPGGHRSRARSPDGWEQQIRVLPEAGSSMGSGA